MLEGSFFLIKNRYFLLIGISFLVLFAVTQVAFATDEYRFATTVGNSEEDEKIFSTIQTSDGGFIGVGKVGIHSPGNQKDVYVVKLAKNGEVDINFASEGVFKIGGGRDDVARSIVQTSDGGYAVAGYTNSYGEGEYDMYIVKLTSNGDLDIGFGDGGTRTVGGIGNEWAHSIIQTSDGGYAVSGFTRSYGGGGADMYIVKLTSSGAFDTSFGSGGTRTIGGPSYEQAYSIVQTSDGGYAVAGYSDSFGVGYGDMYIVKLTSNGAFDTSFGSGGTRTVGGANYEGARSITQTSDGGYLVAGYTNSYGGVYGDIYIVKLTSSGALDTSFSADGTVVINGADDDNLYSVIEASDGGYIFAGHIDDDENSDMYILKLTSSGERDASFGTNGELVIDRNGLSDNARSVVETSDGGLMIGGYSGEVSPGNRDAIFIKLDSSGNVPTSCENLSIGTGGVFNTGGALDDGGVVTVTGGVLGGGGEIVSHDITSDLMCRIVIKSPQPPVSKVEESKTEQIKKTAQYKHYRDKYKNHTAKRIYEKIKHLKKGDKGEYAYYLHLKANYNKYKNLSKRERKLILTEQEYTDFEVYRKYKGYKKYKELRKKTVWL